MTLTRFRALTVIGVLFVVSLVLATMAILKDRQAYGAEPGACRPGEVPVNLTLPATAADVRVSVLNATGRDGVAGAVATGLRNRHFQVVGTGGADHAEGGVVIRFGPKALGKAWWLRAYYLDRADVRFDPKRSDDTGVVVGGAEGAELGREYDARHALADMGNPTPPPGTCDERRMSS